MTTSYDVVILGAGGGGITAAFEAQRRGAKVALIEKHKIGGECTHSGCVPSKALIDVAKHYHSMTNSAAHGLHAVDVRAGFEFKTAMEHVKSIIDGVYAHEQPQRFNDLGIDTYIHPSGASFIDDHTVAIGDDTVRGEQLIIATGSGPRLLPTSAENPVETLNNENFWALRKQPESIAFLGGGVISAELGQSLARFGTKVKIIDRHTRILGAIDPDIAQHLIDIFAQMGIEMITGANATVCSRDSSGKVCIDIEQPNNQTGQLLVDELFVAIGRVPNIDGLNLEAAGIEYTRHGVTVNDKMQTSVPHICAVGDVASRAKFSHVANYQAEIVVRNMLKVSDREIELSPLPWAIFTDPEIGHVGMTEAEAREKHDGIQTFKVDAATDRFITDSKTGGFLKIVMDSDNRLLGATGIGAHAGEWVQCLTLPIKMGLKAEDIADAIFAYPTYAEIVKKACSRFLRTKL
jgi:pyruvate/2-oxoglutarate dehydrogenase complex dihydrolipoamide dehydrogenase (E3) component